MADESPKMLTDHSDEVAVKVPEYLAPVKKDAKALTVAIENLLNLEKKTRLSADLASTKRVALAILKAIFDCKQWSLLNDHIRLLCKRRAQLKEVIQAVVQEGVKYVDSAPNVTVKVEMINVLREVSEGKIFVELERARLTRILSTILESQGKITEACDMLQEVQVDIMGSMDKKEKAEFLMEQIRLTLDKNDFVRTEVVCKKVNKNVLGDEPEFEELKLKFYKLMIRFHQHSSNYLEICKSYQSIFNTPSIQADPAKWSPVLVNFCVYVLLAPHSDEQVALLNKIRTEKKLENLADARAAIELFSTPELIGRPIPQEKTWEKEFFSGEQGQKRKVDLGNRVIEHNIRVISKYYSRVTSSRLAELLQLSPADAEQHLSDMVSSKAIFAKIDRPAEQISFRPKRNPDLILNEWSEDISQLLTLVEKTCHLINKEIMVNNL